SAGGDSDVEGRGSAARLGSFMSWVFRNGWTKNANVPSLVPFGASGMCQEFNDAATGRRCGAVGAKDLGSGGGQSMVRGMAHDDEPVEVEVGVGPHQKPWPDDDR